MKRAWAVFALLSVWEFGWLAVAFWLLITGNPEWALVVIVFVLASGRVILRPLAWVATWPHCKDAS